MLLSVYTYCLVHMSSTFEDVNIICINVLYASVRACVQFSIQTFKYICLNLSVLPLTCVAWAVYSCVLMWLPVGIYGISSICQLSQQVHPISQIHSCES